MENSETKGKSPAASRTLALGEYIVSVIVGVWLLFAPFVLNYSGKGLSFWNDIVLGILTTTIASVRLLSPIRLNNLSWLMVVLGFWLMMAPFIFSSFSLAFKWNDIITGFVIIFLGAWNAVSTKGG